jgi:hypothetical protein
MNRLATTLPFSEQPAWLLKNSADTLYACKTACSKNTGLFTCSAAVLIICSAGAAACLHKLFPILARLWPTPFQPAVTIPSPGRSLPHPMPNPQQQPGLEQRPAEARKTDRPTRQTAADAVNFQARDSLTFNLRGSAHRSPLRFRNVTHDQR